MAVDLIYRNVADTIGPTVDASAVGYIGFAPTGEIHLGYLVPCMKIRDLTVAGCRIAIMLADIHAMLDERKTPEHLIASRSLYYERVLTQILSCLGADMTRIRFVRGSVFQLTPEYTMKVWEMASRVTINAAKKAGTEVVKQNKDPKLGSVIYPIMQATDEQFIGMAAYGENVMFELGGLDQRKIFCFSYDNGGSISYLMNPIISLSKSGKMSASDPNGKIALTDSDASIRDKIKKAFCADGDPNCGLMALMRCVFFALQPSIIIPTDTEPRTYLTYPPFEDDFRAGIFTAIHLKQTITTLIIDFLTPIREYIQSPTMQAIVTAAYPAPTL